MKTSLRTAALLACGCVLLCLAGCSRVAHYLYLRGYDHEISSATREIAASRDNPQRAAAYAKRGHAYSEKARYSRAFHLIAADEYERWFSLAIQDHDQAIALDPGSAEAYYSRGQTYYDRAFLETVVDGKSVGSAATRKAWFEPAASDFKKAVEIDSALFMGWDMLGLSHEGAGELDEAINDYTREMALNPLGRARLADAYCARGGSGPKEQDAKEQGKEKNYEAAIADYEKSIEMGATADGCSCDPYNPLLWIYTEEQRYDQGWEVVHKAQKSRKWIEPEFLEKLKKESGRSS